MNTHTLSRSAAAILLFSTISARSQGTLLFQHLGANNPLNEGFTFINRYGTTQVGPVINDLGMNAWSMGISASGADYSRTLPSFAGLDWQLSVTMRVAQDSVYRNIFFTTLGTGQSSYYLLFGLDPTGDPAVQIGGSSLSPVFVLEGAGSTYHNYELIYSAGAGTADLWVDGVERFSDIAGGTAIPPVLQFGGGYQNFGDMQANWNLVSLQIVPEPSTLALVGLGGCFVAAQLIRRRRSKQ